MAGFLKVSDRHLRKVLKELDDARVISKVGKTIHILKWPDNI